MKGTLPKKYELMMLVTPKLSKSEYGSLVGQVQKTLQSLGAEIVLEHDMGLRDLAYKIKTFSQGYYYVWNFHIDGKQLKELNQTLLHENSVLRHLVITVPNEYNFVAVMHDMDKRKGEKAAQLAAE